MQKGGNGDGVSHTGDAGMDDDALAAAMEQHFAPFAATGKGAPQPAPATDDEDDDPEVTAITRRLDRTGDTLGAIDELEQLLIERTGQIPVVSPELLASAARGEGPVGPRAADAEQAVHARAENQAELEAAPESAADSDEIDWSLPVAEPLDPAPGFSPWVDPDAIAAAFDATAATEFTDVSTKVFAVFSADKVVAEPEPPAPIESVPVMLPAAPVEDFDELDGIDDPVGELPPAPPEPEAEPEPVTVPVPEPAAPARKRRFWPFGRR